MTDYKAFTEQLKKIITPALEEEEVELVELNFVRSSGNSLLRLLVDRAGGVSLDDCARLNEKIGSVLEAGDTIKEHYVLEVSSPGLHRPLITRADFLRSLGKNAKFFLNQPINGKIEIDGLIKTVEAQNIVTETKNGAVEIPLDKIIKAKQII